MSDSDSDFVTVSHHRKGKYPPKVASPSGGWKVTKGQGQAETGSSGDRPSEDEGNNSLTLDYIVEDEVLDFLYTEHTFLSVDSEVHHEEEVIEPKSTFILCLTSQFISNLS